MPPCQSPSRKPTVTQTVEKARRLQLEHADRVGVLDEGEGEPVIEWDVVGVVEVDRPAGCTADLGDGVRHRGLHPHPEHVQLEEAHVLDVLLVGLDHRVLAPGGRLDRQPVQEGRVGEDHSARVHRDPARQRVQPFGELPQRPVPPGLGSELPEFGQFGEGGADVAGPDVGEGFRDPVDGGGADPEREAGVPQGVPGAVGLGHAGDRDPIPPETVDDPVVDLQTARGLDVDVDVRQRRPALGQEPFEEQVVLQRVRGGDEEAVVDHGAASEPRAATRMPMSRTSATTWATARKYGS